MAQKTGKRQRHVPQRTCVGCRSVQAKRSLVRVVRTPDGVSVDLTGKQPGRGAYVHEDRACWERALKGGLAQTLKTEITQADLERLRLYVSTLPVETEAAGQTNSEKQKIEPQNPG